MNVRDAEVIAGLLGQAGFELVETPEAADAVILNTCSPYFDYHFYARLNAKYVVFYLYNNISEFEQLSF